MTTEMDDYDDYFDYFEIGERFMREDEPDPQDGSILNIGTVVKVGRKWVHLRMDRTGEIERFDPDDLVSVGDNPGHSSVALTVWLMHLGHSNKAVRNWYPGCDCGRMSKAEAAELFK